MGFEKDRIEESVDDELMCPICNQVLECPLWSPSCEHAFCEECINSWLTRNTSCPVDRGTLTQVQLKPVPRFMRNLLARLRIRCDYHEHGCSQVVDLDGLKRHTDCCDFNPFLEVQCELGCEFMIPKNELPSHNCVKELKKLINKQNDKLKSLENKVNNQRDGWQAMQRQLDILKGFMRAVHTSNPNAQAIEAEMAENEVVRWTQSLPHARVSRWGGMISTPDPTLQAIIRRALVDTACPASILHPLMERAHERNWPPGLSSLETRQLNRRVYDEYVSRRLLNKQAVIIMACENQHVPDELITTPGMVFIFAHGVD